MKTLNIVLLATTFFIVLFFDEVFGKKELVDVMMLEPQDCVAMCVQTAYRNIRPGDVNVEELVKDCDRRFMHGCRITADKGTAQ